MSSKRSKSPDLITSSSTDFKVIRDRINQFIIIAGVVAALLLFGFRVMVALHFTDRSTAPETRVQPVDPRIEERRRAEALRLEEEAARRLAEEVQRSRTERDLELFLQEWVFYRVGHDYYLPTLLDLDTTTNILKVSYSYEIIEKGLVVVTHTCRPKRGFENLHWDCNWISILPRTVPSTGKSTLNRQEERLFTGTFTDPFEGAVVFHIAKNQSDIPDQDKRIVH
jgi:hypothetical protein